MTQAELRTKIRELMASGVLPSGPPLIERPRTHSVVKNPLPEPCTVCGEPGPQVSYFYLAGFVVRVHAPCDALWQQERTLLWVVEKLELAASRLEADDAPIQERLQRALLEMHAVWPADLPHDLREQLDPVRRAMSEVSHIMPTMEAQAIGQAILRLRDEVKQRIEAR
jgi:hypothetical protein